MVTKESMIEELQTQVDEHEKHLHALSERRKRLDEERDKLRDAIEKREDRIDQIYFAIQSIRKL